VNETSIGYETWGGSGERTYADTVARGFYGLNAGGLSGKYDNVRAYWEDEITRVTIRPHLRTLVRARGVDGRGLRVLDLGCGAGQGFELLTRIDEDGRELNEDHVYVLPEDRVEVYLGLDLSEAMVQRGRQNHRQLPGVRFEVADLREGLGPAAREEPFDLYYSSYGALSHLDAGSLRRCIGAVARHAVPGSVMVLDLLGRLSPEWPSYWLAPAEADKTRPYSMSYLYSEAERRAGQYERFPIRFWTGDEVRALCAAVTRDLGIRVEVAELVDRSTFVGRHTDTGEFGTWLPPLRGLVNRLYEQNLRTRLDELRVHPRPVEGAGDLNAYFAHMASCWNTVVDFTNDRLHGKRINVLSLDGWRHFGAPLQMALVTIDRIIDSVAWMDVGDVRANVIEPQLAHVLRRMQHQLQEGRGCGHGLLAVLRIGATDDA
jgi:SAM-dependent methyltransferase